MKYVKIFSNLHNDCSMHQTQKFGLHNLYMLLVDSKTMDQNRLPM